MLTLYPVSSPFKLFDGGGDHRTYAAVLFITPTRTSVGGDDGIPSIVLAAHTEYKGYKVTIDRVKSGTHRSPTLLYTFSYVRNRTTQSIGNGCKHFIFRMSNEVCDTIFLTVNHSRCGLEIF